MFEAVKGGMAEYGEWTKAPPVRDFTEPPKPLAITSGERRHAGATRAGTRVPPHHQMENGTKESSEKGVIEVGDPRRT
ncbi:hypothetical protein ACFX2G_019482 [Malus domestica]